MNYSEKLRAFADYLDKRPDLLNRLSRWDYPSIHLYCNESNFAQTVTAIGTGEKSAYEGQITFYHIECSKDLDELDAWGDPIETTSFYAEKEGLKVIVRYRNGERGVQVR